jgi:hypothetical protein
MDMSEPNEFVSLVWDAPGLATSAGLKEQTENGPVADVRNDRDGGGLDAIVQTKQPRWFHDGRAGRTRSV